MNDELRRPTSIRRRLLLLLISLATLMVSCVAAVTYYIALQSANSAYDRSLLDPAFDIAENIKVDPTGVHIDLPQKALEALVFDQVDKVIYQVRSDENALVDGAADLPPPPAFATGQHLFYDSTYHGEEVRVAALRPTGGFVVQVAETLHKRNRLVWDILAAVLVASAVIALGSIALAWFGLSLGLRPLERLRLELISREPTDLRPIDEGGAPIEIAPVVRAFNRLLGHLRDANSMQTRFLADAAHQLRTPLAGLQMHLELLFRRDLAADVRAEVDRMHSATVRASRLANQLLALAKAESVPDQSREYELFDLHAVASAAAQDWAPRAFAQKIDLGFDLEQAVILGDSLLLPELLDNLIDNALRYTPAGGSVTVATGSKGDIAYLSVTDTGSGIPPEERTRVLERFYRIAGTPGDGSGLGLSIVHEVAERHGATVEIHSSRGGGTCVRVTFPNRAVAKT